MWEHQRNWWNRPEFIKVLVGGYGAGKTMIASKRAISLCIENAPVAIGVVSPTFPLARKTTIETIISLLAGKRTLLGPAFQWRYNRTLHEFSIFYRGRKGLIYIMSGDDPESLRGPNLAAALIDEPFIQPQSVFDQMVARVRHPDAVHKEICLTGTPEQLNWGYDLCMGDLRKQMEEAGVFVAAIQASTRKNLALDKMYQKRLEGVLSAKSASAYIEGNFVNMTEGLVYYGFNSTGAGNVLDDSKLDCRPADSSRWAGAELGVGIDFNVNPMSALVFWKKDRRVHFFKEYQLPNADTEYLCSTLREDFEDLIYAYPDYSGTARHTSSPGGRSDFWYLKQAGFQLRTTPGNPAVKDRYNSVNGMLGPKAGETTCTISAKGCKKLVKYLNMYSHELKGKKDQVAMSHLLDAFGYPLSYLYPVKRDELSVVRLLGH